MKLYKFRQNNSDGQFLGDYLNIFIEAENEDEACQIALYKTDIYFNGCENGSDCPCCGDRWSTWCDEEEICDVKRFIKKYNKKNLFWRIDAYKKYSPEDIDTLSKVKVVIKKEKKNEYWEMKNLILLKNNKKFIFDMFTIIESE